MKNTHSFSFKKRLMGTGIPVFLMAGVTLALLNPMARLAQAAEKEQDSNKEWQETSWQLPAAPQAENLLPFYASSSQSFSLDAKSLSVASDGSIRYSLISTSTGGAKNISYEGIRCQTAEKKLYAFGRPDGSWSASRRDQWEMISDTGVNKQHSILLYDYFCEGKTIAGKAEQILGRIKRKQPLKPY